MSATARDRFEGLSAEEVPALCAQGAHRGKWWYVCDLPAGHLDEPHNNEWHQQSGGPTWRYVDGKAEFA